MFVLCTFVKPGLFSVLLTYLSYFLLFMLFINTIILRSFNLMPSIIATIIE